jgi:hypothetical protein
MQFCSLSRGPLTGADGSQQQSQGPLFIRERDQTRSDFVGTERLD